VQQEVLEKNPATNLHVYVAWLPMLPFDARSAWDPHLLNDRRVVHLWDEHRVAGRWFGQQVQRGSGVSWDAYYLYPPDARWEAAPPALKSAGSPVIEGRERLRRALAPFLAG